MGSIRRARKLGVILALMVIFISIYSGPADVVAQGLVEYGLQQLRIPLDHEPATLNPIEIGSDRPSNLVINQLYESFFRITPGGLLEPAGATDFDVSLDGLVYTIHLREGALWSDGSPVITQNYIDGMLALGKVNPEIHELREMFYSIEGFQEWSEGILTDPNGVGLLEVDDYTLQITLREEFAPFPYVLALPWVKFAVRLDGNGDLLPVFNGPYLLEVWQPGDYIVLTKNTNYWDAENVFFQVIYLPIIPDPADQFTAYKSGQLDVSMFPNEAVGEILADPNLSNEQFTIPYGIFYLALNPARPPTDDLNLRIALASSINRKWLLEQFDRPWSTPALGIIPPGMAAYQGMAVGYPFNAEVANNHLNDYMGDLGITDPSSISIQVWSTTGSTIPDFIPAIADMWRNNLGITVNVISIPLWDDFIGMLEVCRANPNAPSCTYNSYRLGWLISYNDPWLYLNDVFHPSDGWAPHNWDNNDYRDLISTAKQTHDDVARNLIYQDAERILVEEDAAVIPINYLDQSLLIKPNIQFEYPGSSTAPDLKNWSTVPLLVTTTADEGPGSLRQAIIYANERPGPDVIEFDIPTSECDSLTSVCTIQPLSAFPDITDPITIDGTTQPNYSGTPIIELDGTYAVDVVGLAIFAGDSTIKGLVINRYSIHGVMLVENGGNTIEGCYIGTDATGSVDLGNAYNGIEIGDTGNNLISGNIISGNGESGILLYGSNSTGNKIQGNIIGTNVDGDIALPNADGIWLGGGTSDNSIGGNTAEARNIISGNNIFGISLNEQSSGNQILGNFIGTDITGNQPLGNLVGGIVIGQGSNFNKIGSPQDGAGNLISGNSGVGINIVDSGSAGNIVQGNHIGTNASGTSALPNSWIGIWIGDGATDTLLGGLEEGAGNLISGNGDNGVNINNLETTGTHLLGNHIGTNLSGDSAIPNGGDGVYIGGSQTWIGGIDPGAGNLISGNNGNGIVIADAAMDNTIQGNLIGIEASGTIDLGNSGNGVYIFGSSDNVIGGLNPGARNVISGNGINGIQIFTSPVLPSSSGNSIQGNFIGTDINGEFQIGNDEDGINIFNAANNTIGGIVYGSGNLISGNGFNGVRIVILGASGNVVQGNLIGTNAGGDAKVGNGFAGVEIQNAPYNIIGGDESGAANVISGNRDGVFINSSEAIENVFEGNYIGTDLSGNIALGNRRQGVYITHAPGNIIRNSMIAFNGGDGVRVEGILAVNNTVTENSIFANVYKGIETIYGGNTELQPPTILEMLGDRINGIAPANTTVEIFADNDGEGQTYLGSTAADGSGYFSYADALQGPNLTATATDADGNTSEFSLAVPWAADNCELNDTYDQACDAAEVLGLTFTSPGVFESYISRPGDVDWFYFDLPVGVRPGSQINFTLSGVDGTELPANFDLAILSELAIDPSTETTPLQGVPLQGVPLQGVPLQGVPLQGVDAQGVPLQGVPLQGVDVNDIPLQGVPLQGVPLQGVPLQGVPLQGVPLQGVGFHQGRQSETVSTLFRGGMTGRYYVMVWSSTGEFSTDPGDSPYEVKITFDQVSVEACSTALAGQTLTGAQAPLGNSTDPATLILLNLPRMNALYGGEETTALLEDLYNTSEGGLVAHQLVNGLVVDLGTYQAVAEAYEYWDANGCDPEAANLVTLEIKKVINNLLSTYPSIRNLVLVGNDLVIPMRRVPDEVVRTPDGASVPNEYDYQAELEDGRRLIGGIEIDDSPTFATLQLQYYLSDDFYADLAPVLLDHGHELSVPDLPTGRMVEYPWEIRAYIQAFLDQDGIMVPAEADANSLTTGYSFLIDQAMAIDDILEYKGFTSDQDLIGDDWARADLIDAFTAQAVQPVINSINAHADHWQLAPPIAEDDNAHILHTSDPDFLSNDVEGTLLFSVGCHLGFNFIDHEAFDPFAGGAFDFPQALIQHGGTLIGNWGFGYGDDAALAYSEELMTEFTRQLGNSSIGHSLLRAKREYLLNQAILDPVHEKVLMEAILYGLPMWEASAPAEELPEVLSVDITQGSAGELTVQTYDIEIYQEPGEPVPGRGSFYSLAGKTQVAIFRPIQPKASINATTDTGEVAHGVLFTGGSYSEITGFDPVITMPSWTRTNPEPQFVYEGWDPPRFWSLAQLERSDGTLDERLVFVPGQFQADKAATLASGYTIGTQRLYDHLKFDVTYSPAGNEFLPPIIHAVNASVSSNPGVMVTVQVEDPQTDDIGSSGIEKVIITYTQREGGNTWQSTNLEVLDPSSGLWGGTIDVNGGIDFFVQAVDGSGNVGMFAGNGYFSPFLVDVSGPGSSVQGQPVSFKAAVPGDLTSPNFLWDFGDGSKTTGKATAVHTFSEPGTFIVSVKVVDSSGNLGEDSMEIFIEEEIDPSLHDVLTEIVALIRSVKQLPDEAFKNSADDRRDSLEVKLSEVGRLIITGDYESAINKLINDFLSKMDGCPPMADSNDWVINCIEQEKLVEQIIRLIEDIEHLD